MTSVKGFVVGFDRWTYYDTLRVRWRGGPVRLADRTEASQAAGKESVKYTCVTTGPESVGCIESENGRLRFLDIFQFKVGGILRTQTLLAYPTSGARRKSTLNLLVSVEIPGAGRNVGGRVDIVTDVFGFRIDHGLNVAVVLIRVNEVAATRPGRRGHLPVSDWGLRRLQGYSAPFSEWRQGFVEWP